MRKSIITRITVVIILSGFLLAGCRFKKGSGNIVSEKRVTAPFKGVSVGGDFDVEVKQGNREEVMIEADDNLIQQIETEVRGGILRIRTTDRNLRNSHFSVYITAPVIDDLGASASASIEVKGLLRSERTVELDASSGGEITAEIDAPEVIADASSAGEMNLSGRTRNFKATTSSGASIKAIDLLSETSTVSSSSGATAKVYASVSLNASASSGADIIYRGNANVKKSTSSGAEIRKED